VSQKIDDEATMDGKQLETGQATRIYQALWPALNYLFRLRTRMEEVGFRPDDPLYLLVAKAYDAMHHLRTLIQYTAGRGRGCHSLVTALGTNH
jgi:hypothetical protein